MAQLKSISAFPSSNLAFHGPKRESYPYHGKVCCPGKLSSFQELAARKSELQGNTFAVTSSNGIVTRALNKQDIRAVLPTYSETEVSGSTKERGLRGKLNKVVLAYSGGLDTSVIVPWLSLNIEVIEQFEIEKSLLESKCLGLAREARVWEREEPNGTVRSFAITSRAPPSRPFVVWPAEEV
ncbi:hypothetical protein CerSpe_243410 [Prunus speciosa]